VPKRGQSVSEQVPLTYSTQELARLLGVVPVTIHRSNAIPGRLLINKGKRKTVRFLRTAVDQWLSGNERKCAASETAEKV